MEEQIPFVTNWLKCNFKIHLYSIALQDLYQKFWTKFTNLQSSTL